MVRAASLASLAALLSAVSAQTPLASRRVPHNQIPYKVDTEGGVRGPQAGYNICNSTTQNQESLCQTAYINSIDDFCLWGAQDPNSIVGNIEGEMVAFCTKAIHGTRLIPPGTLTGVQFIKTPNYVQVTGRMNQVNLNIEANDFGGEMDPIGADQRGNPIGSLAYTNQFTANSFDGYQQVIYWHNFMGGSVFCYKACRQDWDGASRMCEHIYDRIGCAYNAPASYAEGVFESCDGQDQDPPGIYTGLNGQVSTYTQPPESLGVITSIPYTPRTPLTSNCVPFQSAALYADANAIPSGIISGSASASSGSASSSASALSSSASSVASVSSGVSSTSAAPTRAPSSSASLSPNNTPSTSSRPAGGAERMQGAGFAAIFVMAGVAGMLAM